MFTRRKLVQKLSVLIAVAVALTSGAAPQASSRVPADTAAIGLIATAPGSSLGDGETFILTDATGSSVTFEFDSDKVFDPASVVISFLATDSAAAIKSRIVQAVNNSALAISAQDGGYGVVWLTSDIAGVTGNRLL